MNPDQGKAALRYLIAIAGAGVAGWAAKSGYVTAEQVTGVLNSEAFLSFGAAAIAAVWGVVARSNKNMIASVAALPVVQEVKVIDPELAKAVREEVKSEPDPAKVTTKR